MDRISVVPEVYPVHVFIREPHTDLVRVIYPLPGAGLERPAAGYHGARSAPYRVERRLLEGRRIDVGRERLAVDRDIHPALVLARDHVDSGRRGLLRRSPGGAEDGQPQDEVRPVAA